MADRIVREETENVVSTIIMADRTVREETENVVSTITMADRTVREETENAVSTIIMADRIAREEMENVVHLIITTADRTARADIITIIIGIIAEEIADIITVVKANSIWTVPSAKRLLYLRIQAVKAGEIIKTKKSRLRV